MINYVPLPFQMKITLKGRIYSICHVSKSWNCFKLYYPFLLVCFVVLWIDPRSRQMLHKHPTGGPKPQPRVSFRGHALYRLRKWKLEQLPQLTFVMRSFAELLGLVTLSWRHTSRTLTQPIRKKPIMCVYVALNPRQLQEKWTELKWWWRLGGEQLLPDIL